MSTPSHTFNLSNALKIVESKTICMPVSATEVCLNVSQSIVCKNKLRLYIVLGAQTYPWIQHCRLSGKNKTVFPYWHCSHKIVGSHPQSPITNLKCIDRQKKIFIVDFMDFVLSVDFISSCLF